MTLQPFLFLLLATYQVSAVALISDSRLGGSLTEDFPSNYLIAAAQKYTSNSPVFANATTKEEFSTILRNLAAWTPPEYVRKNFPYYHSGYNYDGDPLWVVEAGNFDLTALINKGPEMVEAAEIYVVQAFFRALRSMETVPRDVRSYKVDVLVDFDGMTLQAIGTPQALAFLVEMAQRYKHILDYAIGEAYLVNVNFVVETVLNLVRPLMGRVFERIETYGSNRNKWIPRLQRAFPPQSLPEWLGGSKDFRPINVYGR